LILGLAAADAVANSTALLALGMEHFRDTASVADDPAKGVTTISTERGFVEGSGPMRQVWHDEFLTAVIDRGTGQKSFQIDVSVTYGGARRSYSSADLGAMSGPKSVKPALMRTESVNCAVGDCIYTDHVLIPVEEGMLRHLAAGYAPGHAAVSSFGLAAKGGSVYRGEISNAEAAGLLARVDGQSSAPGAADAEAPLPPRRLDLGMSGLAVSPAVDSPRRAGVLLVAVSNESVAQQAGLITGDIIYEIDDRPTRSLADLQAAISSSAERGSATIRIFRGLKEMTLEARF
jgi:hypothetical protein